MHNIIVIGGGGHAKVVISLLQEKQAYNVLGYTDVTDRGPILQVPYLGTDGDLPGLRNLRRVDSIAFGIGQLDIGITRQTLFEQLQNDGFFFPSITSKSAVVFPDVTLGDGTVAMAGTVVNTGSQVGRGCIVNTHASIDHDCHIGDFVHVAPGVTIAGGVSIGHNCFLGAGSTIIQGKTVASMCIVGAGSLVLNDLVSPGVYLGSPAKKKA